MTTKITEQNISNIANFAVDWQSVVTADGSTNTTAVAGKGYFIDTTSAVHTIVLPASPSFGDTIIINDYASTFATNNVTINPNGNKIEENTDSGILSTNDQTHTLVYTDSTQGWKIINQDTASPIQPSYISATGGTITQSGDYQIHSFTGDGCFVVSQLGCGLPCAQASTVDYLVIAGGGAGGSGGFGEGGGGGGAGGYRESSGTTHGCFTVSPLGACVSGVTVSTTTYPITVGGGGSGGAGPGGCGSNSVFSTITSAGGGGAGGHYCGPTPRPGKNGGSGGGSAKAGTAGSGNTPPVSPPQGNNGGVGGEGPVQYNAGGGGGATAVGANSTSPSAGNGGAGGTSTITGSSVGRGGGGAGSKGTGGSAGTGSCGGGDGAPDLPNTQVGGAATANTGSGGGGGGNNLGNGGAGGKGLVIIRYKYQ